MDKAVQKVLFAAAGIPGVPYEVVHERDWEEDPEAVEARAAASGLPAVRQAGRARVLDRDRAGRRPVAAARRPGDVPPVRPQGGARTRGHRRARARGLGAGQRRPGGLGRGRDRPSGSRVLRLRGQVPRRARRRAGDPGRRPAGDARGAPAPGGRRVPGDRRGGDGAGRLLPDAGRARVGQRGEHDPGVHRASRCTRGCGRPRACPTPSSSTG